MNGERDWEVAIPPRPQPRHLDLARTLMQGIRSGQPPVGGLLPTEAELCAQWGLSRYMVRQAIQKLCDLGLVTRQPGVGTRILADRPKTKYIQSMDTLFDLTHYARGTVFRTAVHEEVRASAAEAELLRCCPGDGWFHISGVRFSSSERPEAIALVDIYLAARFAHLPDLRETSDVPVYMLVENAYGVRVTRVEQEIQGTLIEGSASRALGVVPGVPGLRIVRSYFVGEELIEVTKGIHPADRFSYSSSFQLAPARAQ
jgi:DNA-binding GntR family transcriptional regulator